ncbi:MAG: glycoside hydrolase family 9 protein [Candidatus Goldiibacteriota bacterium]
METFKIRCYTLSVLFVFLSAVISFSAPVTDMILVDQLGYRTNSDKWVMVKDPRTGFDSSLSYTPGASLELRSASDDSLVMTIPLTPWNSGEEHTDSGDIVWQGEFSSVTAPGTYYITDPANSVQSYNFEIRDDVYNGVLEASMKSYYYQRSGYPIEDPYAEGWTHAASHLQQTSSLLYDASLGGEQSGTERDISGGWYDAGDYRKYTSWMAPVIWDIAYGYEFFPGNFSDSTNIPESGNGVPDVLDEIKYEVDWMLKMQRADGALYSGCFVVEGINGTDNGIGDPSTEDRPYYYANFSTAATGSGAAAFAIAARLFEGSGAYPGYSDTLRAAAELAWSFLESNPSNIQYDHTNFDNADANKNDSTDAAYRLMAAAELFRLTGESQYQTYFDSNYDSAILTDGTHHPISSGYFETGNSVHTQRAMLSYAVDPAAAGSVVTEIKDSLDEGIRNQAYGQRNNNPYKCFMWDGHYTWGSNGMMAQWANMALWGALLDVNPSMTDAYMDIAEEYVHYYHGRNPLNLVYYTQADRFGGDKYCTEIYHGWFHDGTVWDTNPAPGFLPGGPNQYFSPDASYSGTIEPPQNQPPMKSYKDWNTSWPENSWEVTENSTGYQSRLVQLMAAFAAPAGPLPTATETPTHTDTITPGGPAFTYTPTYTDTPTYTATPTYTNTPESVIFNTCDTPAYNGTWSGANASRLISSEPDAVTEGTGALRIDVETQAPWQDEIANLGGFAPTDWSNIAELTMDVYVEPGNEPWGAADGWHQLELYVDSQNAPGGAKWYRKIAASVDLSSGMNNLTFVIDRSLDTEAEPLLSNDPLSSLIFIISSETGGAGTLYFDNMILRTIAQEEPTETYTHTFTDTETYTPTETEIIPDDTPTDTPTYTYTFTQTPTYTNTPEFTHTPDPEPTKEELEITDLIFYPNPYNPDSGASPKISFKITRTDVDSVSIRIYTSNLRLVREAVFEGDELSYIMNSKEIDYPGFGFKSMANGIYFYVITAGYKGEMIKSKIGQMILLRRGRE